MRTTNHQTPNLNDEQRAYLKQIHDYINNYIKVNYNGSVRKFFECSDRTVQKTSWVNFNSFLTPPELPTLLQWLDMAHSRINLILPDHTIQRLTIDLGNQGPFHDLLQAQLSSHSIAQNAHHFNLSDRSVVNFKRKFTNSLSSILLLFSGLGIEIEIVPNDPSMPDIILPASPDQLP